MPSTVRTSLLVVAGVLFLMTIVYTWPTFSKKILMDKGDKLLPEKSESRGSIHLYREMEVPKDPIYVSFS